MSLGQMAAMWKIPGIGRPAVRPGQRLSVDWLKSTQSNGMDAPILLIGIDVPKWRCE